MLEHYGVPRHYKRGEVIFLQESPGHEMFVVRSGKVGIFAIKNGTETPLAVLGQHEFFGEMSLLTHEPRSASARAETDVELSVIDARTFEGLVGDPLVREMLVRMSRRVRDIDIEVERLAASDSTRYEHLAGMLEQKRWFA